jgi:tripartite-type tricarboxylate transporter receptor subunit TctC
MELLKKATRMDVHHVPYKGAAPGLTDLVAGHVALMFTSALSTAHFQRMGKVRVLAVGSLQRSPSLPDVPTIAESGYPGFEVISWWGILGPAAMPKEVVARLNTEVSKLMAAPDARERIGALGADIVTTTPERFASYIRDEQVKWGQAIKESGARVD